VPQLLERDLAEPVTTYLCANGYTVRSEVKGCDITGVQGDELIVIELKRNFSIDLLLQAVERQRVTDSVYVAVPADTIGQRMTKKRLAIERLVKRLELGLLLVHFSDTDPPHVELALHPIADPRPRKKPRQRRAILREIAERSADYNVAGATRRPILTAYREQAIQIAVLLHYHGTMTPAMLRKQGASTKTQGILNRNVYGWFERIDRGVYRLRPTVWEHLNDVWAVATERYSQPIKSASADQPDFS
jgi:hypothetical protein